MTHKEKARELLKKRYHCSQALVGAYADELGLDYDLAFKISTCFGNGMRQGGVCGCITGALMILGMRMGFADSQDRERERLSNKKAEQFFWLFRERMKGLYKCKDILGADITTPEGMAEIRRNDLVQVICPNILDISIEILDQMLAEYEGKIEESSLKWKGISDYDTASVLLGRLSKTHQFRWDALELLNRSEKQIAFIQFDIKGFKVINDVYGEKFGDAILDHVNEQLGAVCVGNKFFVNLRSDVFMITMEFEKKEEIISFINEVEERISRYKNIKLQCFFGVYTVEDRNMELRQMQDRAGMARKAAKNNFLNNILFYREQFKESIYSRRFIEENMEDAVAQQQFKMYLQPKYSISRECIIGAEALVRWEHPVKGMIYPVDFIQVLEENSYIRKMDYYMWDKAAAFVRRCMDNGMEGCPVSVNVSRIHLKDEEFIGYLKALTKKYEIPEGSLELEITETVDNQQLGKMAVILKKAGYRLLMDDFGSGYSSMNILLETPFDEIKLDKKFIDNMIHSVKGQIILRHVVSMSGELGVDIIAEGAESKEQIDLLQKIGCDKVQGYYYGRPVPEEEFFERMIINKEKESGDEIRLSGSGSRALRSSVCP